MIQLAPLGKRLFLTQKGYYLATDDYDSAYRTYTGDTAKTSRLVPQSSGPAGTSLAKIPHTLSQLAVGNHAATDPRQRRDSLLRTVPRRPAGYRRACCLRR